MTFNTRSARSFAPAFPPSRSRMAVAGVRPLCSVLLALVLVHAGACGGGGKASDGGDSGASGSVYGGSTGTGGTGGTGGTATGTTPTTGDLERCDWAGPTSWPDARAAQVFVTAAGNPMGISDDSFLFYTCEDGIVEVPSEVLDEQHAQGWPLRLTDGTFAVETSPGFLIFDEEGTILTIVTSSMDAIGEIFVDSEDRIWLTGESFDFFAQLIGKALVTSDQPLL